MPATSKPILALTVQDVMSSDLVLLAEDTPLRQAAHLLLRNQISGAPVVDAQGKCVGVLSVTDFLRMAEQRADVRNPAFPPLPVTCSFQTKHHMPDGRELRPACALFREHKRVRMARNCWFAASPTASWSIGRLSWWKTSWPTKCGTT